MRRILLSLTLVAGMATAWCQTKVLTLTRQECVDIALSSNPTIKVADMEIQRADYSKKEALAPLFPQVDFSGTYQRSLELQTINMNMGGQSTKIKMGSDNTWNFGFSAAVPLVAPQLWKSLKLSDIEILKTVETARSSRLDMVNAVNQAYYSLLLAKSSREVIKANYDLAVYNADLFKKRFAQGTATEYDTLRSAVQVRNIEPEMLQADIAVKQAQLQLKVLLALDGDVVIDSETTLEALRDEMYSHVMAAVDLSGNTSLRTLDLNTKSLEQNVALQKLAWVPTLSASFNYNWNSINNGSPFKGLDFNPYSTVGLHLSVPIFSGGSKYYGLKKAQVQVKEMSLQRENLVNSLNMQVDLAMDNINRQARQITASQEGVRIASEALRIMRQSFELGAASYLDLRDAELAHTTSQLNYLQSIYSYLVYVSELDLLLGREY